MDIYLETLAISLMITVLLLLIFIPYLRYIRFGQMIRQEGPKEHFKKQGTPTMGGCLIVLGSIITFFYILISHQMTNFKYAFLICFPTIAYCLIGFLDDYLIVVKKNNQGLLPRQKIILQIVFATLHFYFFLKNNLFTTINFFGYEVDIKWLYGVWMLLIFIACSNAVNITDGLDGLAGGLVIVTLLSLVIIASYFEDKYLMIYGLALIGAITAFLCYNFHPAKIFMGDAGSLALGASIANIAIILKVEILLIILGFVFVLETFSVIIQVLYFKMTKGKRIFLMSPLHHHFELKGLSEWQVDLLFWFLALLSAFIGISLGVYYF